jgi:3,4-dihydroxy 2-butanone 4-phosphate synthase/GTP cyclohydrolase II
MMFPTAQVGIMPIAKIEDVIEDIRQGKMIVLMDDKNRENEGDLCMAAEKTTPETVNFMARFGRGLICLSLTEERVNQLGLRMMVSENTSPFGTAFTVSIDAAKGISTGISAADRSRTILAVVADDAKLEDLVVPGHMFPLRARNGGVLVRAGQTEGSVDLARLAGLKPAGVICEVMNDDGTMARLPDLEEFAAQHDLKVATIADLIHYRLRHDSLVYNVASARLPTKYGGEFRAAVYNTHVDDSEHLALIKGEISPHEETLVRVHSRHVPGDVFGLESRNTRAIIRSSMEMIAREGKGVIVYLQTKMNGSESSSGESGAAQADFREYGIGAQILRDLGVGKMRLITKNPKNLVGLSGYGLEITASVPFETPAAEEKIADRSRGRLRKA